MTDDSHYEGALLEDIYHRLQLVQEAIEPFKTVPVDIIEIKHRLERIEDWVVVDKVILKDHNKLLEQHNRRLIKLETSRH